MTKRERALLVRAIEKLSAEEDDYRGGMDILCMLAYGRRWLRTLPSGTKPVPLHELLAAHANTTAVTVLGNAPPVSVGGEPSDHA